MRRLTVAVAALALIVALVLAVAIVSLNRIVELQRAVILRRVEAALGRKVAVDVIAVSLWGGLGVRLEHVRIADDSLFDEADFFSADAVMLRARLWPLLHGRFDVGRIDLQRPQVHLVRDTAGRWNYSTLVSPSAPGPTVAEAVPPTTDPPPAPHEAVPLLISRASVNDGTVILLDHTQAPPRTTRINRFSLSLRDISEASPIRVTLDAAVDADASNLTVQGSVGPFSNRAAIPMELDAMLGPFGPQQIVVDGLHLKAVVTPDAVQALQLSGRAFGGTFALMAQYPLRPDGAATLKGRLSEVDVGKALQLGMADAAQRIAGAAQLDIDLHATGNAVTAVEGSLAGIVTADVQRGVLKDFNLVNEVLERATGLPAIGSLLSNRVKPKYARLFADDTTRFDTLRGTFHIADRRVRTDDLAIIASDYGVRAGGTISFDGDVDMRGTLIMSKHFSDDVVADIKGAKYVTDQRGELALPFRLRGKLGHAKPAPDLESLAATLQQALTHGAAKDLLGRLLGGKHKRPTPGTDEPRDLLERGLHDLLGQ